MLLKIILFLSHGCFAKKRKEKKKGGKTNPKRNLKWVWKGEKEWKASLCLTEKCSSVSKLALCNAEGLIRSRGMYQPLRGICENFSSIHRASLKIPLVLHWRWREDISCPLFPSSSWKTSSCQNEQAPCCTVQQQQPQQAAWLCRWPCHYRKGMCVWNSRAAAPPFHPL